MNHRRRFWVDALLLILSGAVFAAFIALGTWQVQRLSWKLDLIEQVETRAYGNFVPAPLGDAPEYLRVMVQGTFLHRASQRIKAVTDLGPGFWVMTPLVTDVQTIWINRGFVPAGLDRADWGTPQGTQTVTGWVRASVSGGTWLEKNDPVADRWFSADLPVMSARSALSNVAPYYVDAATPQSGWPRGGLTKLTFRNTHLAYAITWYAMAALFAFGIGFVIYERRKETD